MLTLLLLPPLTKLLRLLPNFLHRLASLPLLIFTRLDTNGNSLNIAVLRDLLDLAFGICPVCRTGCDLVSKSPALANRHV